MTYLENNEAPANDRGMSRMRAMSRGRSFYAVALCGTATRIIWYALILLYTLHGDLRFAPVPDHAASAKVIGEALFRR